MNTDENRDIMTLSEVAEYLQLSDRTVLRMAQRGEIPAAKVATQWRFLRSLIREWLIGQMESFPPASDTKNGVASLGPLLSLAETLRPELMTFNLQPGPKESILRQLTASLLKTGFARDAGQLLTGLIDRERIMTTAIGHGVAIPHPRHPIPRMFPEPAIALGICPEGTNFDAIDDKLVHVFFLICATREEIHLQLMAGISWFGRRPGAIDELGKLTTPEEVMAFARNTSLHGNDMHDGD